MSTLKQAMLNMESGPAFPQKVKKRSCNFTRVAHSNVTTNAVMGWENTSKNVSEINNIWLILVAVKTCTACVNLETRPTVCKGYCDATAVNQ